MLGRQILCDGRFESLFVSFRGVVLLAGDFTLSIELNKVNLIFLRSHISRNRENFFLATPSQEQAPTR